MATVESVSSSITIFSVLKYYSNSYTYQKNLWGIGKRHQYHQEIYPREGETTTRRFVFTYIFPGKFSFSKFHEISHKSNSVECICFYKLLIALGIHTIPRDIIPWEAEKLNEYIFNISKSKGYLIICSWLFFHYLCAKVVGNRELLRFRFSQRIKMYDQNDSNSREIVKLS